MKKIKEVYKEVEEEKDNEVDDSDDNVTMTKADFVKEHTELPKILRTGSKEEREAEASKQEKELEEVIGEED